MNEGLKKIFSEELEEIKSCGLYRSLKEINSPQEKELIVDGKTCINFSSNNYLGLATSISNKNDIIKAINKWGIGGGASRLVSGNFECYNKLEKELAEFKSRESSLVFATGYMANVGLISSIANEETVIIIDRLNHASIIDGIRLSRTKLYVYKHCNADSLEGVLKRSKKYKRILVITDSIFSMDGDIAPLKDITFLCEKFGAGLIVDEAHAFGVFGKKGAGIMSMYSLEGKAMIDMGTFSKSAGCLGGYVACDNIMREIMINKARSIIYTTGLPPCIIEANRSALNLIKNSEDKRIKLAELSNYLRNKLKKLGYNTGNSTTQIIPVILGDNETVIMYQNKLFEQGFFVPAIRFPTVPKDTARLRLSLTSGHTIEDIDNFVDIMERI
mgnify:CR=1 FL=1